MTPDILDELRQTNDATAHKAAQEIERLKAEIEVLNETIAAEANMTLEMINKLCDAVAMIVTNKYKD